MKAYIHMGLNYFKQFYILLNLILTSARIRELLL